MDLIRTKNIDDLIEAPVVMRRGIELEKGVSLTTEWLEKNEELMRKYMNYFTAYPDLFIDLISREEDDLQLFFYQRIVLRACMRFKEVYLVACVDGETPVLTEAGTIPIKDYQLGTAVWTKDGWKYPLNKSAHSTNEERVKISGTNCFYKDIIATKEHQFLCWSQKNPVPHWVEAQNLNQNEYLVSPVDMEIRDLEQFMGVNLDYDFYEFLGYLISRGTYKDSKIKIIVDNKKMQDRIISLSEKIFHITPGFDYDQYFSFLDFGNMLNQFFIDLYNTNLEDIFENKRVPVKLLCAAPDKQLQLLKSWFIGSNYKSVDGTIRSNMTSIGAESIKTLLYRNSINPTITFIKNIWSIEIPKRFHQDFFNSYNQNRNLVIGDNRKFADYLHEYDGMYFMLNKVKKVDIVPPSKDLVYCLEFEDGSFNVNGVESHNCRATAKTFLSILALFLQCMFVPNSRRFIVATFKTQAAKVAKEKIIEIYMHWPLLRKEIVGGDFDEQPGNFGKDYVTLTFKNGSILDVVGGDGTRGLRRHSGLLDELRDADETEINEIVLPLLNVARRLPNNTVNPKEPNTQQLVMTSAGSKMHFSYAKLIDMFENSIIDPHNSFVITLDYRIPLLHNLISRDFVNKIKTSPSFNEESFAREYGSIWSGSVEDSWFNFDKMQMYRKIKNPETHQMYRADSNCFYLLSVRVLPHSLVIDYDTLFKKLENLKVYYTKIFFLRNMMLRKQKQIIGWYMVRT